MSECDKNHLEFNTRVNCARCGEEVIVVSKTLYADLMMAFDSSQAEADKLREELAEANRTLGMWREGICHADMGGHDPDSTMEPPRPESCGECPARENCEFRKIYQLSGEKSAELRRLREGIEMLAGRANHERYDERYGTFLSDDLRNLLKGGA
jgi:hypothetical protein